MLFRSRNILGSVSAEIVQKAPCTVTVVRRARSYVAEATAAGGQPVDGGGATMVR